MEEFTMPKYTYDHIHLRTKNPEEMAAYFEKIFDAKVIHSVQSDGFVRTDLDIDGLMVFVATVPEEENMDSSPRDPHLGLDHFGFRVENLEETVAELKERGAEMAREPRTIRPGVHVAFVRAPDDVRIELLQRD